MDNGTGINYNLHVNSKDTNGVIVRYYWDERETFDSTTLPTDRKTPDSLFSRFISTNDLNTSFPIWIYARDDDGFVRGGRFKVYADGPPPVPALVGPAADTLYSTPNIPVVLKWTMFDKHDSLATEYAVLVNPPGTDTPEDSVQVFKAATQYVMDGNTVTYTPGVPGIYSWRIIARNMQKSITSSATRQFSHPGP